MIDKERLVELIQNYDCMSEAYVICDECGGCTETCIINEKISPLADYLIANNVMPVIRCKDCKYFKYDDYCDQDKMEHSRCRKEDFCSYAEPKARDEE